jgi:hypothetical protein
MSVGHEKCDDDDDDDDDVSWSGRENDVNNIARHAVGSSIITYYYWRVMNLLRSWMLYID